MDVVVVADALKREWNWSIVMSDRHLRTDTNTGTDTNVGQTPIQRGGVKEEMAAAVAADTLKRAWNWSIVMSDASVSSNSSSRFRSVPSQMRTTCRGLQGLAHD